MKELKLAWRYVRRHWWQYILGILALFIVDEVNTYVPRFTGEITNGLDQHTLDMGGVMGLVWKIVLIGVIIAVGRFAWRFSCSGRRGRLKRNCAAICSRTYPRSRRTITTSTRPAT